VQFRIARLVAEAAAPGAGPTAPGDKVAFEMTDIWLETGIPKDHADVDHRWCCPDAATFAFATRHYPHEVLYDRTHANVGALALRVTARGEETTALQPFGLSVVQLACVLPSQPALPAQRVDVVVDPVALCVSPGATQALLRVAAVFGEHSAPASTPPPPPAAADAALVRSRSATKMKIVTDEEHTGVGRTKSPFSDSDSDEAAASSKLVTSLGVTPKQFHNTSFLLIELHNCCGFPLRLRENGYHCAAGQVISEVPALVQCG
jgi:hypothetical protein